LAVPPPPGEEAAAGRCEGRIIVPRLAPAPPPPRAFSECLEYEGDEEGGVTTAARASAKLKRK
jgi:hypothetical protein